MTAAITPRRGTALNSPASPEDRWTLPFAIVMLLLFALFLSLYSLSKKETARLAAEMEAVRIASTKPVVKDNALTPPDSSRTRSASGTNADLQLAILNEAKSFLASDGSGAR